MDSTTVAYLIGILINAVVAYWLYNDANSRGRSGILWGVLGFFFSLITLIVWLIVRPKNA